MKHLTFTNALTNYRMNELKKDSFLKSSIITASMVSVYSITTQFSAAASIIRSIVQPSIAFSHILQQEDETFYADEEKIFKKNVDVKALYKTIKYDFMPYLIQNNYWFAVWYILKDNGCLNMKKKRAAFCRQMVKWFDDDFSSTALDAYAATCLSHTNWKTWDEQFFEKFRELEATAINNHKISLRTAKRMPELCKVFDAIVKEKCFKRQD